MTLTLQRVLRKWCQVSGAKFNVKKTVVIPVGTPAYRQTVIQTRRLNAHYNPVPPEIEITSDGTPTRILGAYVGNGIPQLAVWTPVLEKIDTKLKQWSKSHPTQDGKRLIINMVVGGLTQYLTSVQGMSAEVEKLIQKKITKFLWDDTSPMVNAETMNSPRSSGGKSILNLSARNDAIRLMKLKSYLADNAHRPKWAKVADSLIKKNIPTSQNVPDGISRVSPFLQSWTVKVGKNSTLPQAICDMFQVAKKFNVDLNPPLPHNELCKQMPIWFHKGQDMTKSPKNNGKWATCLRQVHNFQTVGELLRYTAETQGLQHFPRSNCACPPCRDARQKGCPHPVKC